MSTQPAPPPNHAHPAGLALRALATAHAPAKLFTASCVIMLIRWLVDVLAPRSTAHTTAGFFSTWGPRPFDLVGLTLAQTLDALLPLAASGLLLFRAHASAPAFLISLIQAAAAFVAASLAGGVIGRACVVELAGRDRPTLFEAIRFAVARLPRTLATAASPFVGIGLLGLACVLLGLAARLPEPAARLVTPAAFLVAVVVTIPMAWLVVGMIAGWPLVVLSVVADDADLYEALSRAFGYVFRRKVFCLVMAAAGLVLLTLGRSLFALMLELTVGLARGALSLGAGFWPAAPAWWPQAAALLTSAWTLSAFWCLATAAYLTLRHNIDGTPPDALRALPKWGAVPVPVELATSLPSGPVE